MIIAVFDTETTSLEKPFCYNIGYCLVDTNTKEKILKREFVVEQVWNNLELFSSAYYADKRPIYVKAMRARKIVLDKFGYITQQMIRDFKAFDVVGAYAYNSPFDEKVFAFCCDWFKVKNPFDNVPIYDIRGYVHEFAVTDEFCKFCEENKLFTESGNYSTTAETLYCFITKNAEYVEEHTALADSEIETDILNYCIDLGAEYGQNYCVRRSIERPVLKNLTVVKDGEEHSFEYYKRINRGDKIFLK